MTAPAGPSQAQARGRPAARRAPDWPPAHALISGGSSGIGLAVAHRLAAEGARVSLLARDPDRLAAAAAAIGPAAQALPVDLTDRAAAARAAAEAEAAQGPTDLLVCCAGAVRAALFEDLDDDAFAAQFAENHLTALHLLRPILPGMRARGGGRVLLIGSAAGLVGLPGYAAYGPAKFALRGLAQTLRAECAPDGVSFTVFHPPDVDTPQLAAELRTRPGALAALSKGTRVRSPDEAARSALAAARRRRGEAALGALSWVLLRLAQVGGPITDAVLAAAVRRARR